MKNCEKCNGKIPTYIIIKDKLRNLNKRKFCLECSPFGEHNTRNLTNINSSELKKCPVCTLVKKRQEFYWSKTKNSFSSYCIICTKAEAHGRQIELKKRCLEYKGGECQICGYNKCLGALHFHHRNQDDKNFTISHLVRHNSFEKIKIELDKCDLICANCHAEQHEKLNGTP